MWVVDALNVVIHLLQAPESLAYVLKAAGGVTLERCGAILDEWVAATLGTAGLADTRDPDAAVAVHQLLDSALGLSL